MLSTDDDPANKQEIARNKNAAWRWVTYPNQISAPIYLEAGQKYYIEAIHKEKTYNDYVHAAWTTPASNEITTIPGEVLSPYGIPGDYDLDHLLDNWETTHFGNLGQSYEDDPDGDGLTNLVEYASGLDPNSPNGTLFGSTAVLGLTHNIWTNLSNETTINDLTNAVGYPNGFSKTRLLTETQTEDNLGDSYGQRIHGYLHPPVTGTYKFRISGSNSTQLWLGSSEAENSKSLIAYNNNATDPNQWDKYPEQESAEITLVSGQKYYFEILHKAGVGEDHLNVQWEISGSYYQTITDHFLTPSNYLSGHTVLERWYNVEGPKVIDLRNSPNFPDNPDDVTLINRLEIPQNHADNYGARIRSMLRAPQSGDYTFWVAGDNYTTLWLSTDRDPLNKIKIAFTNGATEYAVRYRLETNHLHLVGD